MHGHICIYVNIRMCKYIYLCNMYIYVYVFTHMKELYFNFNPVR